MISNFILLPLLVCLCGPSSPGYFRDRSCDNTRDLARPRFRSLIRLAIIARRDVPSITLVPVRWLCGISGKVHPIATTISNLELKKKAPYVAAYPLLTQFL
jgi:hypothetical protein